MYTQLQKFVATILLLSMMLQSCTSNLKLDCNEQGKQKSPQKTEQSAPKPRLLGGNKPEQGKSPVPSISVGQQALASPAPHTPTTGFSPLPQLPPSSDIPQPTTSPEQAHRSRITEGNKHHPQSPDISAQKAIEQETLVEPQALQHILAQSFTSSEGKEVCFCYVAGLWQAQVTDLLLPSLSKVMPVVCEGGGDVTQALVALQALAPSVQKQRIHVLDTIVYVGKMGLAGGGNGPSSRGGGPSGSSGNSGGNDYRASSSGPKRGSKRAADKEMSKRGDCDMHCKDQYERLSKDGCPAPHKDQFPRNCPCCRGNSNQAQQSSHAKSTSSSSRERSSSPPMWADRYGNSSQTEDTGGYRSSRSVPNELIVAGLDRMGASEVGRRMGFEAARMLASNEIGDATSEQSNEDIQHEEWRFESSSWRSNQDIQQVEGRFVSSEQNEKPMQFIQQLEELFASSEQSEEPTQVISNEPGATYVHSSGEEQDRKEPAQGLTTAPQPKDLSLPANPAEGPALISAVEAQVQALLDKYEQQGSTRFLRQAVKRLYTKLNALYNEAQVRYKRSEDHEATLESDEAALASRVTADIAALQQILVSLGDQINTLHAFCNQLEQEVDRSAVSAPPLSSPAEAREMVTAYLQAWGGANPQERALLETQGQAMLKGTEGLKKQLKTAYRRASREFATDHDTSEYRQRILLESALPEHKLHLTQLRELRSSLVAALNPDEETLEACGLRTEYNEEQETYEQYSSDEEQLYSDYEMQGKQAFLRGVGSGLLNCGAGCIQTLLNPLATVESYMSLLVAVPALPKIIEQYTNEFLYELDDEARAEQLGQLLTEAMRLILPSGTKITDVVGVRKKLGKAAERMAPKSVASAEKIARVEALARKLKLNLGSPTTRQILDCLDDTVDFFTARFRKASIRAELPEEFLHQTIEQALKSGNTTVRKLLIDTRFVKNG